MFRHVRPWLPCISLAALAAVAAVVHGLRPRLVEPEPPPAGESRQWMRAPYLQYILHGGGLDVSVVSRDGRDDAYYVFDGEPEAATAGGLRAEEEDADRWRGVVLVEVVEARPGPAVCAAPTISPPGRSTASATPNC